MIGASLVALATYFIGAFTLAAWATWEYPRQVSRAGGTKFLQRFQFLFFRFSPQHYYFALAFMLRSALIALLPVLLVNEPQCCILLLINVVGAGCAIQCYFQPWRTATVNLVDASLSLLVLSLLATGSLMTTGDEAHVLAIAHGFLLAVFVGFSCMVGVAATTALLRCVRAPKRYGIFLSHHKRAAAVLARWFKIMLQTHTCDQIFLDSDELDRLDKIFDVVAHESKYVVALLTAETLQRIWCAGELAAAVRSHIELVIVACSDFQRPTEASIGKVGSEWTDAQKNEVLALGVSLQDIQDAYRAILEMPMVLLDRRLPQAEQEALAEAVAQRCPKLRPTARGAAARFRRSRPASPRERYGASTGESHIAIAGNMEDPEAACVCCILQRLLQAELQSAVAVLGEALPQPPPPFLLAALTQGVLQQASFAVALLAAHRAASVQVVPVVADYSFQFPDPSAWDRMQVGLAGPDLSSPSLGQAALEDVVAAYKWMFSRLAIRFSAHGSARIQRAEIAELALRFSDAMAPEPSVQTQGSGRTSRILPAG